MNSETAMYMAQVLNTGAFIALAVWYVVPRLRNLSRGRALMALTAVHLGRTLCLQVYCSQDAGMKLSLIHIYPRRSNRPRPALLQDTALKLLRERNRRRRP